MPDCTYFFVPELTEPGRGAEVCLVSKRMFIPDGTPVPTAKYYILTRRNRCTLNMVACSATSVESCLCLKAPRGFPRSLEKSVDDGNEESSSLDLFSLEMFENIAYIMAKHAHPDQVPDTPDEWLENFNTFSIYQILPQLIELWGLNVQTEVEARKNLAKVSG